MCNAKFHPKYRDLLLKYANEKRIYIFGSFGVAKPDLELIKIYKDIWCASGFKNINFFWLALYDCVSGNKRKIDVLKEIYDYLFDWIGMQKTEKIIISEAKKSDMYDGYANWNDISYSLFSIGYIVWSTEDYHYHKLHKFVMGDKVLVKQYEKWMKDTKQVIVPLVRDIKIIEVIYKKINQNFEPKKIYTIHSKDKIWTEVMKSFWNDLSNDEDKNEETKFTTCNIFCDRFQLNKYLGLEFFGEEPIGKMIFGDLKINRSIIRRALSWTGCNIDQFLPLFQKNIKKLGYKVMISNEY